MTLSWTKYLRQRDLYQLMDSQPISLQGDLLEIGCGDGHLSTILRDYFDRVISTDLSPREEIKDVIVADAQDLPFRNNTFDAIFSSNVLEHIDDLERCLNELYRISKKDAVMLHTMPTIWWKIFQFMTHYIYIFKVLVKKIRTNNDISLDAYKKTYSIKNNKKSNVLWPAVHGVKKNHIEEIIAFRSDTWTKEFSKYGFKVIKKDNLFVHSPYRIFPYHFLGLRKLISNLGMPSVIAYWVIKE